jgi:predicted chitinase
MITFDSLVAAGIGPTQARAFAAPITQTCDQLDISTTQRQAAFVAQCAHESRLFVHLEEDLFWRDQHGLRRPR